MDSSAKVILDCQGHSKCQKRCLESIENGNFSPCNKAEIQVLLKKIWKFEMVF